MAPCLVCPRMFALPLRMDIALLVPVIPAGHSWKSSMCVTVCQIDKRTLVTLDRVCSPPLTRLWCYSWFHRQGYIIMFSSPVQGKSSKIQAKNCL
jgi:hypothetical protein